MLIGELAARTGASRRMLRYYGEQDLLTARRGPNGYRVYDDAERRVAHVRCLLDAGLSTAVVRSVLPCVATGASAVAMDLCPELVSTLRSELAVIDARIADLRRNRGALSAFLPGDRVSAE